MLQLPTEIENRACLSLCLCQESVAACLSLCLQFTPQLTNPCKRNAKSEFFLKHNMVGECGGTEWNVM